MPNWCYNRLVITGPQAVRAALRQRFYEEGKKRYPQEPQAFTFHAILPMPVELEETRSPIPMTPQEIHSMAQNHNWPKETLDFHLKNAMTPELQRKYDTNLLRYGSSNWYEWCCVNWGVKWDATDVSVNPYNGGVTIHYNTAWGPPAGFLHALAYYYRGLTIRNYYSIEGYPGRDIVIGDYRCWVQHLSDLEERKNKLLDEFANRFVASVEVQA